MSIKPPMRPFTLTTNEESPAEYVVLGGNHVGEAVASRLHAGGHDVLVVTDAPTSTDAPASTGIRTLEGNPAELSTLGAAGLSDESTVLIATRSDARNLLVAQLAKTKFDIEKVLAKANNSDNVEAFKDLDVSTISATMSVAWALDNQIERTDLAHWMTDVGENGDVQEVTVTNEEFIGKSVREVGPMLPDACLIAVLSDSEHESVRVPSADTVINRGDHVTLLGQRESVREGMTMLTASRN